ncbi:MAG: DUF3576 domain-containing protein [Rhodospirillales bacterium]|nr:DUF3576 domain-containing protein [Rhodospirillales bacterium]MDE2199745.1 DUF3576 domain-containing protein [Rhodospirillales bacterium]
MSLSRRLVRLHPALSLLAGAALLAGCSQFKPAPGGNYYDPREGGAVRGSLLGSGGLFSLGGGSSKQDQGAALGVNAYLWRGALDTLSFMPLASADPFGGVIITDWYQPPSSSAERFKATAYILGRQLRADGVKVSIFRQVQQGGQWVDAGVDPATVSDIENRILERARQLRTQSTGG